MQTLSRGSSKARRLSSSALACCCTAGLRVYADPSTISKSRPPFPPCSRNTIRTRYYATYTELPAAALPDQVPPPSPQDGKISDTRGRISRHGKRPQRPKKEDLLTGSTTDMEDMWDVVPDGSYERVDMDYEGNFPGSHHQQSKSRAAKAQAVPADPLVLPMLPDAGVADPESSPIPWKRRTTIKTTKWRPYQSDTAEPESFETFRKRHRNQANVAVYDPEVKAHDIQHLQPSDQPLVSRYDWRLRAPSRSLTQKQVFGGRTIWRKKDLQATPKNALPGLEAYQTRFRRFIELEREEAENTALARLRKKMTASIAQDGVFVPKSLSPETIVGLKARVWPPKEFKTKGQDFALEAKPAFSTTTQSLVASMDYTTVQATDTDMQEEFDQLRRHAENMKTVVSFSLPGSIDLPDNAFRKGKTIFVWKCRADSAGALSVPALEDPDLSWEELKRSLLKAVVKTVYKNRIDVILDGHTQGLDKNDLFRIDIGYDDTSFSRMQEALEEHLPADAAAQRQMNDDGSVGPHLPRRDLELFGTELRDVILQHSAEGLLPSESKAAADIATSRAKSVEMHSDLLMDNQHIASWAHRYARKRPLHMEGDPELQLNDTQLRAVAYAIKNRLTLIQGPPGTGKTATIVAALGLLKRHFAIPIPILVCAHTNVAVDLIGEKCAQAGLKPLRFGFSTRIAENMQEHSLEVRFQSHPLQPKLRFWTEEELRIQTAIADTVNSFAKKNKGVSIFSKASTELLLEISEEKERVKKLIDTYEAQLNKIARRIVKLFKMMQSDLIESSDVCLATCVSSRNWPMQTADFPLVFLDEAGQCDEPTSLIPLMKGCRHLVLIGDHKQLPSVVSSQTARNEQLNISMFERLIRESSVPSVQLDLQYRMLPSISAFPNQRFYYNSIRDSVERQAAQAKPGSNPVQFVQHEYRETRKNLSVLNAGEADIIMDILQDLVSEGVKLSNIGVISAYAAQTALLSKHALRKFKAAADDLEIATVDGFQGREKQIIILSTVRSNPKGSIGFLSDPRRLNVALTRAQERLFVVGNMSTLSRVGFWDARPHVFNDYMTWIKENDLVRVWPKAPIEGENHAVEGETSTSHWDDIDLAWEFSDTRRSEDK